MKAVVEGLYGVQNLGDDFLLCSIVQTLLKADKDIKIHVFSSGGYAEIKDAFPEANIKFINGETRKEILFRIKRKILRYTALFHCDIYIFGGLTSYMDALALQMPIIASDNVSFAWEIDEYGLGLLYKTGDIESLKAAIRKLHGDENFFKACKENIAEYIMHSNIKEYSKQLWQILNNLNF